MQNEGLNQHVKNFMDILHAIAILCWHERWLTSKQIATLLELCHDEEALHRFCQTRELYKHFLNLDEAIHRGQLLYKAYTQQGVTIIFSNEKNYPPQLRTLAGSKPILSVSGRTDILCKPQIAIVGSRNMINAAIAPTQNLAKVLIERGYILTSGGAIGIDALAHRCAIQAKQPTIIVTATSVDRIYPKENSDIYDYCRVYGAIVSHSPIDTPPERRLFPSRNKTIAGLSQATIIAQAGEQSGALYTARASFSLNRPVYVLGMPAFDEACQGGFRIVSEKKAKYLAHIADLEELLCAQDAFTRPKTLFDMPLQNAKGFQKAFQTDHTKADNAVNALNNAVNALEDSYISINSVNSKNTGPVHKAILNKIQNAWLTREMLRSSLDKMSYDDFNSAILDLELSGLIVYTAGRFRLNHP